MAEIEIDITSAQQEQPDIDVHPIYGLKGDKGERGLTGNGISSITLASTVGLVDTYNINYTDGNKTSFTVTNGEKGEQGEQGIQGIQGEQGIQGIQGETGATPNITVNASVNNTVGTPSVNVTKTGTDENPIFSLAFQNLKGETGSIDNVTFGDITGQVTDNIALTNAFNSKQDTLVSGTNIKTINNNSILGSGNLTLDGLPDQEGNAGKFLTTDGTDASWAEVQTGANQDINNLTSLGNARLQYAPFSINAGTVINGNNHTLQSGSFIQSYSTPGTYTLEITESGNYEVVLVGGGGGAAWAHYRQFESKHTGGSAAMCSGTVSLEVGTYTIVVGAGASNAIQIDTGATATASKGGDTTAFQITAGGGGGAWSHAGANDVRGANGTGGTYTTIAGVTGTNGVAGSTTSVYSGNIGAGGAGGWTAGSGGDGYFSIRKLTGDASKIFCDPCTITTCDGRTKIFDTASSIDIADYGSTHLITKDLIPSLTSDTSSYGTCSISGNRDKSAYQFTDGSVAGLVGSNRAQAITFTMQLSANNYLPANKIATFQISSSNGWGNEGYGISGVKITYTYTDDTTEVVYDNSSLINNTWNETPITATATCNASSGIAKTVLVETYRAGTYGDCGNFTMTYEVESDNITDGSYSIFKDYETGDLSLVDSFKISNLNPSTDYWLDTSTTPANLKVNGVINNDLVYIGDCTIENGGVTVLNNRAFNDSGYLVEKSVLNAIMPDYNAGVSLNAGSFTPTVNGFVFGSHYQTGNVTIRYNDTLIGASYSGQMELTCSFLTPVLKGQTYSITKTGSGQCYFYPVLGS